MQLATNTNGFLSLGNAVISIYSFYFKYVSQYNQRATIPDGLCSSPEKLCHIMCPVVSRVRLPFQYYVYYMRLVYSHDLCRFCQYCLKTMGFFGLQRLLQHFGVQSFDFARTYYSYFRNTSCSLKLIPTLLPKQYFNLHGLSCIGSKIETQSLTLHVSQRQTLSHKVILSTLCHGQ